MEEIKKIVEKQHEFFHSNKTKSITFRLQSLVRLENAIKVYENRILEALQKDLNKSSFEGYMTEIGMVRNEISYFKKHLRSLSKTQRVKTPLAQFPAKSFVISEPLGVVFVIAPWNYPFQLSILPLVGAIAAGNTVIVKPSSEAPYTSNVMKDMIEEFFPEHYISILLGGAEASNQVIDSKVDYIFFTGGARVGRLVMERASKHLTPVSLELGGKSPCIIDRTADIKLAAKRIVFGKLLNAGQTCVAPDYIYVHKERKEEFIFYLVRYILAFYGDKPLENKYYPKIINQKHYDRLLELMENEHVVIGGYGNGCKIAPTILDNITLKSNIMEEEIFGPILPILTYTDLNDVIEYVKRKPKPLALYLFTKSKKVEDKILSQVSFGGGCINDTIVHLATHHMGFGGVGESGMGRYHGKYSFDTFSHKKSILKKSNYIDIPMRYLPYSEVKEKLVRLFLR